MIKFRMAKINVVQFAILSDTLPDNGLSYSVGLGFKCAPAAMRIGCTFTIEVAHNDATILKLEVFCEFDIKPDDWNSRIKDSTLTITCDELGYFANQAVGTARGIMFCKTEGTPFSQFILPPVNITKLLDEDFTIDLSEQEE